MTCNAGGDATLLHNKLRDYTYQSALAAGMCPEREEPGLLPDDPRRRPGDVYFATWPGGSRVAIDFAVTSPLQQAQVNEAAHTQLAAAVAYEGVKLADRDTARRCAAMGITLMPAIAESFSGWGPVAQKAFNVIARASATRSGLSVGVTTSRLYEGLSTIVMRANAHSLLARVGRESSGAPSTAQERARSTLEA